MHILRRSYRRLRYLHALEIPTVSLQTTHHHRFTTCTAFYLPKPLPPLPPIHASSITETFLKGSGPGGQKINKTSSAVQLQHHATGIVVKCQATRSRSQNRKMARRLLQERIEELELGDQARSVKRDAEKGRKKRSREKKARRKYRALGEKAEEGDEERLEWEDAGEEVVPEGESQEPAATSEQTGPILRKKTHRRHLKEADRPSDDPAK